MKNWGYLIVVLFLLGACSSGKKALDRGNYSEAIEKAVNRLSSDPDNKKAQNVVRNGYPMAMDYYQEEIDHILNGNDPFKWGKTLQVMNRVNHLSNMIRRIPAARKIVSSPKVYTSELSEATNRAAEERYQAGLMSLSRPTREDAKDAYYHFAQADQLVPSYKDVLDKMYLAKDRATIHVILESIAFPLRKYELSAEFFYEQVINRMKQLYPSSSFVAFYTPDEANRQQLDYPDMVVRMEFYDFFIGQPQHFEKQENLDRIVEREVEVKVGRDSTRIEKRQERLRGKIKIISDEVMSQGLLNVKIEEFQSRKLILSEEVPGEFLWRNQYGIFVGDEGVLTKEQVRILNNKAVPPPAPQDLFIEFTRPIYARLTDRLNAYFRKYN
ncbi:hypothetical protein [uncultured Sunxiuqinia sp.]|uniref:hypothetical protein n=1 Tax=uncultured Sunxiuqinia sp. TaxID=1573825 RepID=UPI0026316D13|nr:hypothetical protein [uncultured Sunxiuqinia sp.]